MFKLHRHRSEKLGGRTEFRFSNLQAFKIPQGWDKLVLSIISVESGKLIVKSGKATVRSGTCQWTDFESIWVSKDEASNELDESQFKIVISMGSARSGILGEVILNVADYLSSEDSESLLLPLNYCEFGSALQVQIQCFAAKPKLRIGKSLREKTSHLEDLSSNHDDIDNKLGGSNHLLIGSTSRNQIGNTLLDELGNRNTTRSILGSHRTSDSGDSSLGESSFNQGAYVGCQNSAGSHVIVNSCTNSGEELSGSNQPSFNVRASGSSCHTNQWEEISPLASQSGLASLELGSPDSCKVLLEAAEELEELHDEVKMWEKHAEQLKADIETLEKELSEKSKHLINRDMELSAAHNERDNLMQEVQLLQLAMESMAQKLQHTDTGRDANSVNLLKELEDEVKLQKESNANLVLQLKKSQESNLELVAILEELEDTVEKTKHQVSLDMELSIACSQCDSLKQEVERLQLELEESLTEKTHADTRSENSVGMLKELEDEINFQKEKNANLMQQLKKSQESSLELVAVLQELEETVEKSKNLMGLDMELSAACSERDSLKQEIERLQLALEESLVEKRRADSRSENSVRMLKELEDEINFQKETNANLMLQLKKSQESSLELVSILQELEETAEKSKNLMDLDMELSAAYSERDSLKQEVARLQLALEETMEKRTDISTDKGENSLNMLEAEVNFQKESNANLTLQLKKSQESNLELLAMLQELEDTVEKQALEIVSFTEKNNESEDEEITENKKLLGNEVEWERRLSIKEQEIARLEEQLSGMIDSQPTSELDHNGNHFDLIKENEALRAKIQELERDCLELTDENMDLIYKLKKLSGDNGLGGSPSSEFVSNILHHNFEPDIVFLQSRTDEPIEVLEKKEVFGEPSSAMLRNLETLPHDLELDVQHYRDEAGDLQLKLQKLQVELEEKKMELSELKRTIGSTQGSEIQSYIEELDRSKASFEEMKSHLLLKEQEINNLMSSKYEQENIILGLQKEKGLLEDNLSMLNRESNVTSKSSEDVQRDVNALTSSLNSQIFANKVLEEKSLKLESHIKELDLQISELEQEKLQLSKGIAALQDELKYFENDKESNRLELEDSKLLISNMKVETEKYKAEMEMQKADLELNLHEALKQISESQAESDTLKQANLKLQVTIESLDEEYSSLQRLSEDLKKQKLALHEHVTHLEVELEHTQTKSLGYFKQVEVLEEELSSLQKKTASREKLFLLQIDQIIEEHEEKIIQTHSMLKKVESEKRVEVENLARENAQLRAQMSSTKDELEKIASDAIREATILRSDKAKLEFSLNEANAKVESYETDVHTLRQEYRVEIDGLVELLNASKHSEEMLMADIQDMKRLVNDAKYGEENSRNLAAELEIKLKVSDYEKQQITEEMSVLKIQLEKISKLQDDILVLKHSIDEEKFEKEKLGGLLSSSSEECQKLKMERDSLMEKLTSMQELLETKKDDNQEQMSLQQQLLGRENDLSSKEASSVYEAEIINELNEIKRANSDYQRKIKHLEDEIQELTKKAELIEKESMLTKEANDYEKDNKVNAKLHVEKEESHGGKVDQESKIHVLEQKLAEALEANNVYKEQLDKFVIEKETDSAEVSKSIQVNSGSTGRVSSLEAELKEMKERYLHMSLQYAEVEAQREELVLQLKSVKKEKRWFS